MKALYGHLEALKADRNDMIDRMVASGDRVANMKGLATLQSAIMAFEAEIKARKTSAWLAAQEAGAAA